MAVFPLPMMPHDEMAAVSGNPLAGFNDVRLANPLYPFETEEDRWLADYFFRHGLSQGALKELIAKMKAGFNWEGVGYKDYKGMKKIIRKVPLQVRLLSSPPPPDPEEDRRQKTSLSQPWEKVSLTGHCPTYKKEIFLMKKNVRDCDHVDFTCKAQQCCL